MRSFAEREEVEELCDVVPPDLVVSTLFLEARTDSCALLLDNGSFVGNGLGGAHVADELLHCTDGAMRVLASVGLCQAGYRAAAIPLKGSGARQDRGSVRELIVGGLGPARGPLEEAWPSNSSRKYRVWKERGLVPVQAVAGANSYRIRMSASRCSV